MFKTSFLLIFLSSFLFSSILEEDNYANCEIIKENNKILCTYHFDRIDKERIITFNWISPSNKDNRKKSFIVPKNHSLVYDYRTLDNREFGEWKINVKDLNKNIKLFLYLEKND